jgi:3',5'-cyclic AMP phosphodiesterase CpdA
MTADSTSIRLAHFSDIHVAAPHSRWRLRDWLSKRLTTWANFRLLGRREHFLAGDRILSALAVELHSRPFDRLVFSGDATAMGFEEEVSRAAEVLGVGRSAGLAVPGNHDYCTPAAMRSGAFERHFNPWLQGERVDDATYPFAQRVGPAWLVAVNSAMANLLPHDARGRVGAAQLARLERLLQRLGLGPRLLVTHYPVYRADGQPEKAWHGLRDVDALVEVARRGKIVAWLHGHLHTAYHLIPSHHLPFALLCAGSTTHKDLWTYGDYTLSANRLLIQWRTWDDPKGCFRDGARIELELGASVEQQ